MIPLLFVDDDTSRLVCLHGKLREARMFDVQVTYRPSAEAVTDADLENHVLMLDRDLCPAHYALSPHACPAPVDGKCPHGTGEDIVKRILLRPRMLGQRILVHSLSLHANLMVKALWHSRHDVLKLPVDLWTADNLMRAIRRLP